MSISKLLSEMKQEQNKSKSEQDWNTFMNALPVDVKGQMDNVAKELNYSSFDQLKGKSPLELSSQDTTNILKAFQKHVDTTKVSFNDLLSAFDAVKEKAGIKTENSNISGILKNLKGENSMNENSGVCVVLYFSFEKQSNNSSSLLEQMKTELVKTGLKFRNKVQTKSVLELYFDGYESSKNIIKETKDLVSNKFSNKATNFDVYAIH